VKGDEFHDKGWLCSCRHRYLHASLVVHVPDFVGIHRSWFCYCLLTCLYLHSVLSKLVMRNAWKKKNIPRVCVGISEISYQVGGEGDARDAEQGCHDCFPTEDTKDPSKC